MRYGLASKEKRSRSTVERGASEDAFERKKSAEVSWFAEQTRVPNGSPSSNFAEHGLSEILRLLKIASILKLTTDVRKYQSV